MVKLSINCGFAYDRKKLVSYKCQELILYYWKSEQFFKKTRNRETEGKTHT
jgi:hypothetical protein